MFIVDSHCHLDFPDFEDDRDAMIERARENGVRLFVTISTKVAKLDRLLDLTRRYDSVYASVGTHPNSTDEEPDVSTQALVTTAQIHEKIVAIGEAGLDYHYDRAPRDVQKAVFCRHIAAARETQLPLVIHARDADDDVAEILREEAGRGAFPFILHCFSSGRALAKVGVELGGYVSFSGILTFKKSDELRAIAAEIPSDRLLVETDAPYLAPMPYRGKRNEPGYTRHTAEVLADLKGVAIDEIAQITSDNFFRLFWKVPDPRQGV